MPENIKKIAYEIKSYLFSNDMTGAEFSEKTKLPTATVSRLVNGKLTRMNSKTRSLLSEYFGIPFEVLENSPQLIHGNNSNKSIFPEIMKDKKIKFFYNVFPEFINSNPDEYLTVSSDISIDCFAVKMFDNSMARDINKGDILIFKPINDFNLDLNNKVVLIKDDGKHGYIIRKLITDNEDFFIKQYNPDNDAERISLLEDHNKIVAWCKELTRKVL